MPYIGTAMVWLSVGLKSVSLTDTVLPTTGPTAGIIEENDAGDEAAETDMKDDTDDDDTDDDEEEMEAENTDAVKVKIWTDG